MLERINMYEFEILKFGVKNIAAIRTDGNIQPQPSMTVEKVSMDEGDIENTTGGNESIWSLLKSENYERLTSDLRADLRA